MLFVCVLLLAGGCDLGRAYLGGLVANNTRQDLIVEVVGASEAERLEIRAQSSGRFSALGGECLGTGVAIYSADGEQLTTFDEQICDGKLLTIEEEDLAAAGNA